MRHGIKQKRHLKQQLKIWDIHIELMRVMEHFTDQNRFCSHRCNRKRMAVWYFSIRFQLAERLDASYVGEDGKKHIPVMIHRAVLGSFERFIGILIENYAGKLPFWLSPQQVVVASIISDVNDYSLEIVESLKKEVFWQKLTSGMKRLAIKLGSIVIEKFQLF